VFLVVGACFFLFFAKTPAGFACRWKSKTPSGIDVDQGMKLACRVWSMYHCCVTEWTTFGVGVAWARKNIVIVQSLLGQNLSCFLNKPKTELLLQRLYAKKFLKDLTKVLNRTGGGA